VLNDKGCPPTSSVGRTPLVVAPVFARTLAPPRFRQRDGALRFLVGRAGGHLDHAIEIENTKIKFTFVVAVSVEHK
jgi:hypothetical protein